MKKRGFLAILSLCLFSCNVVIDDSNDLNKSDSFSSEEISSDNNFLSQDNSSENISSSEDVSSENIIDSELASSEGIISNYENVSNHSSEVISSETIISDQDKFVNPRVFPKYDYTFTNLTSLNGTKVNKNLDAFSVEGFAHGVTGGGIIKENSSSYIKVSTADEFIKAINRKNVDDKLDSDFPTRNTVIEIVNDIDLGWNKLSSVTKGYSDVVEASSPLTHPILKETGVSLIYLSGRQNLTIYSKNGAKLKHACFQIRGYEGRASSNIIIRNIEFDGIWEWDDSGSYDKNDWDQFTLRADKGEVNKIWFDHCTFHKTYDGTIDIKYGASDITISWCKFISWDENDEEFMAMMNYLENNRASFPNYDKARKSGASLKDMIDYASINKKVHLIGHSDNNPGDENIKVTYCNNYYLNCVERLPRLRLGKAHCYNNIYDASEANLLVNKIKGYASWPSSLGISMNGSQGTNYGHLLLENCYINGINTPLRNNMKKVDDQYVGSVDALYTYYTHENISRTWSYSSKTNSDVFYNGRYTFLGNSTNNEDENLLRPFPSEPISFNTDEFKKSLGYEYILYEPTLLYLTQNNKGGASAFKDFNELWLYSSYDNNMLADIVYPNGGVLGSTSNLDASRA